MSGSTGTGQPEPLVALDEFARVLSPKMIGGEMQPGEPDEVWIKLMRIKHRMERHSITDWRKMLDRYRDEPAHPTHPDYTR